jgi:hypothetical protein
MRRPARKSDRARPCALGRVIVRTGRQRPDFLNPDEKTEKNGSRQADPCGFRAILDTKGE